ncbi:MAG: SIR2 family NAD-dependent protein deacylase [Methylovirgula sp.]
MEIVSEIDAARATLQELIDGSQRIVAFTGAGISTECGVPDFRSKNSPWLRLRPIDFDIFLADVLQREEAWRRKFALDDIYGHAQPGRGHWALANLVAQNKIKGIITQNIDNLHQASGVADEQVVELHGNGSYAACLDCGKRHELLPIRRNFMATGAAPACTDCGGIVKTATISFGQALPEAAMRRAHALATDCDLFLAIGSSLVVYPAAAYPAIACQHGARLVIINDEKTPLDEQASVILRGDIGDIFAPFAT